MRTVGALILALILTCNIASAQDTLYIYKSGSVVTKRAIVDIDSVTFYKASTAPKSTVTDIDGNVYHTVTIGTQVWMIENLKTTKYRNGDLIGTTTSDITGQSTPKYQWACDGNESNVGIYGRLYTWYAATDGRNVCPIGWHLPTAIELKTLITYLGGGNVAGGKLKEVGTSHWLSPNEGATNETGFTALPGGDREVRGTFYSIGGSYGYWWSSTEDYTQLAWTLSLSYFYNTAQIDTDYKSYGFSVRCIKD